MSVELGVPVWTTGKFTRATADNDLGLESVGAFLLRRLLPGVLQGTYQAGYYAFYAYLLAKWEDVSDSVELAEFVPFFRRQELAYATACRLHAHRVDYVNGIQGSQAAGHAIRDSEEEIDLGLRSEDYVVGRLGGYGAVYARMLEATRLTKPGAYGLVDRVTERGRVLAASFASVFESTGYYTEYFREAVVPIEVLADLGKHVCLCTIPDRADHQQLLDVFLVLARRTLHGVA